MLCEIEQFVYIVSISTIFAWIFIEFGTLVPRTLEILILKIYSRKISFSILLLPLLLRIRSIDHDKLFLVFSLVVFFCYWHTLCFKSSNLQIIIVSHWSLLTTHDWSIRRSSCQSLVHSFSLKLHFPLFHIYYKFKVYSMHNNIPW